MLGGLTKGVWAQVGQVWAASMAANLLLYLFQVMVGRRLAPDEFGQFAALFGIVYIAGAASNAVQTSVARTVSISSEGESQAIAGAAIRRALLVAAGLVALGALLVPAAAPFLHLDDHLALAPVGAVLALAVLAPVTQGAFLGEQRFSWYSTSLVGGAAVRLIAGWAALSLGLGATGALWAIAAGVGASFALGLMVIRPSATSSPMDSRRATPGLLLPTLFAFLAISVPASADVLAVRHLFSAHDAGLYGAVALLGRIVLFLPLAVSLVLFPRMAREVSEGGSGRRHLFAGLAITSILSGSAALIFFLAPGSALDSMLGGKYSEASGLLPTYAGAMFLFALAVVFVYYHLARGNRSYVYLVLIPHIALQAALPYLFHDSLSQVTWLVAATNLSLVVSSAIFTFVPWIRVRAVMTLHWDGGQPPIVSHIRVADPAFRRLNPEPLKEDSSR